MSNPRFLLDEHLPRALATGLRRRGIDAITLAEAERLGLPDEDQLAWARNEGRVMVTHDSDYLALATQVSHAGIAYCRAGKYPVGALLSRLEALWLQAKAERLRNDVRFL